MATPNYAFEKRQKELAKKRKKQEKQQQKSAPEHDHNRDASPQPGTVGPADRSNETQ
jgi:hypothetical protein